MQNARLLCSETNKTLSFSIEHYKIKERFQYLLDTHQKRPIVLFYANRTVSEIVYKDVFDEAQQKLGIRTIYIVTDKSKFPPSWHGKVGYIYEQLIKAEVPNYRD